MPDRQNPVEQSSNPGIVPAPARSLGPKRSPPPDSPDDNGSTATPTAVEREPTTNEANLTEESFHSTASDDFSSEDGDDDRTVAPSETKTREYYMTAADPAGDESPQERLKKLLTAKYNAGLLAPFNYALGYNRLNKFMERHVSPENRKKVLGSLNRFRPIFRERAQNLTDVELVMVEVGLERMLMDYDRNFASMSIPACCWRRSGEILRGNKEMAELINVSVESLRDVSGAADIPFLFSCFLSSFSLFIIDTDVWIHCVTTGANFDSPNLD